MAADLGDVWAAETTFTHIQRNPPAAMTEKLPAAPIARSKWKFFLLRLLGGLPFAHGAGGAKLKRRPLQSSTSTS
jgi:hypothetical protein